MDLPPGLATLIAGRFPHLLIPTQEDLTGGWARISKKRGQPFAAQGDFNGDGRADIALILLGAEAWELIAFHARADGGYDPLVLNHFREGIGPGSPAQDFHIFTVRKGGRLKVGGKPRPRYERDSIGLFVVGGPGTGMQLAWTAAPEARRDELRRLGFYSAAGFNTD